MAEIFKHDAFIAYAGIDISYARQLYALLSAIGLRVFFADEALLGGDSWAEEIAQAQQDSLLTLILISDRVDPRYFQRAEILHALDIAREDYRRRVMPVYLMGKQARSTTSPLLKPLQGIYWEEGSSLLSLAQKIEAALRASKRQQDWAQEIVRDTILIVTGCYERAEMFDRPCAYELKMSIDHTKVSKAFLRSVVMGDIWFCDHIDSTGHPNVISIGSPGINHLSRIITERAELVRGSADGPWQIMRYGNRWAVFGHLAEDTYDAINSFRERDLPGFITEIWSPLLATRF